MTNYYDCMIDGRQPVMCFGRPFPYAWYSERPDGINPVYVKGELIGYTAKGEHPINAVIRHLETITIGG